MLDTGHKFHVFGSAHITCGIAMYKALPFLLSALTGVLSRGKCARLEQMTVRELKPHQKSNSPHIAPICAIRKRTCSFFHLQKWHGNIPLHTESQLKVFPMKTGNVMENIKYHLLTTATVLFASYMIALTSVMIVENTLFSDTAVQTGTSQSRVRDSHKAALPQVEEIIESTFFEKSDFDIIEEEQEETVETLQVTDLTLLGTISGPESIARAMIRKKGERTAEVFKVGMEAYGYSVIRIEETKVTLKAGGKTSILDMYPPDVKKTASSPPRSSSGISNKITQTLSRAELNQILQGKMDNMLRGIRAGPYRENGEVVGYMLKLVSSQNILYKFGLRSGDILRRINGHPITSTQKLFELWQSFHKESRVVIDIQRNNDFKTFDFTIND